MATQKLAEDDDFNNIQTSMTVQAEAIKRKKYIYGGVALLLTVILIIVIIVATTSGGSSSSSSSHTWPVVVVTWGKNKVADSAFNSMTTSQTVFKSLDGVVEGVRYCQSTCNVKANGVKAANVDSEGNVTQSAMVIWGPTMETGAVANLYDIDDAVGVAKHVLIYTDHAMLVGEAATRFAVQNGFQRKDLYNGSEAQSKYNNWLNSNCEKNYWRNVKNGKDCSLITEKYELDIESSLHDITGCDGNETGVTPPISQSQQDLTGGMVTGSVAIIGIDSNGEMAIATSSNGLDGKIAGRVSDAAIPGAGGYIDPLVGGCVATGAGDVIIRFAPARTAVTFMKQGLTPQKAAQLAIDEIEQWCGDKQSIVLCLSKSGVPGIANNEASGKHKYAYRSAKCDEAVAADVDNPRGTCR